jgi:hypothetical protein
VDSIQIGSRETKLVLVAVERSADGAARLIRAGVHAPLVNVEVDAYEYEGYDALAAFFEGLAESWRGWDEERSYTTLEGDLELVARHDGHVRLTVALRSPGPAEWDLRSTVVVDPGEDLDAAARGIRDLVGLKPER